MSVELHDSGEVIIFRFSDPWSLLDLLPVHEQAYDYYEAAPHPLCFLVDWTAAKETAPGLIRIRHSSPNLWHPNCREGVVVDAPEACKQVADTIQKMGLPGAARFHFVDTMDEGWAFLRQVLATPSPPNPYQANFFG